MLKVLILEEKIYPSTVGQSAMQVRHHKPIKDALRFIGKNDFKLNFEYAIDIPIQQNDIDPVTFKNYENAIDKERVFDLINDHDIIIPMGSKITELILGNKLTSVKDTVQKKFGKIFIPTYSCYYMYKNKKPFNLQLMTAYNYASGNIVNKDFTEHEIVMEVDRVREIVEYRNITGVVSFDYETTGLEYFNKDQVATVLSLTFQPGYSYIIPFQHKDTFFSNIEFEEVLDILRELFSDPNIIKVAHNAKFDLHWLRRYSIKVRGRVVDTMLMHHLINENMKHGLKRLTRFYASYWTDYDIGVDFLGPLTPLSKYAAIDTDITLRLFYIFENELLKEGNEKLYRLFRNLTIPSLLMLQEVEYRGCRLDRDLIVQSLEKANILYDNKLEKLKNHSEVHKFIVSKNKELVTKKIIELEEKIKKRKIKFINDNDRHIMNWSDQIIKLKTGQSVQYTEVNFASPKQMNELLYDGFQFPLPKVMENYILVEKRSSSKNNLQHIDHVFVRDLLAIRSIAKMISTYYIGLLDKLDTDDFIHGSFLIHGTTTGRLASRNPNLQNIPSRSKLDDEDATWTLKQVKKFFVPIDDNHYVLQADYSQAELRIIANASKDPTMIKAYLNDEDLHAKTGAKILSLTEGDISYEDFLKLPKDKYEKYRYNAKPTNFGWVYKSSIEGYIQFAKSQYGVVVDEIEAQKHKDALFGTYKTLGEWHIKCEAQAKQQGYMETMFGRRRRFENINNSTNISLVNQDIRNAINNPIQGTGGEYTIFAMIMLWHRLPSHITMWSTVHDSIFFNILKTQLKYVELINDTCENPPIYEYFDLRPENYPVPMKMDYELSDKSWGDMKEVDLKDLIQM